MAHGGRPDSSYAAGGRQLNACVNDWLEAMDSTGPAGKSKRQPPKLVALGSARGQPPAARSMVNLYGGREAS